MKLLLNDKNTYKIAKCNPLTCLQKSKRSTLMELNKIDALNKKYNNPVFELSQIHTMLPEGYGLPEVHKPEVPLKMIISTINSPCHKLTKIVVLKKPLFHIDDNFALIEKLKDIVIPFDYIILSFDVTSLFINITL